MIVIPAIDIRRGNSVRLKQGKIDSETIYSTDPVFIAKLWKAKGAKRIHIVDLDGAFSGINTNENIIKKICEDVDISIEVGGGIRDMHKVDKIFSFGVSHVILGTVAIYNPEIVRKAIDKYGPKKIIVSIDAKNGKIAISGWKDITPVDIFELVDKLKNIGVEEILYTDISRDGMFTGPDLLGLKKLCTYNLKIIASGGIRTIDDVIKIKKYEKNGVFAVVVGSALYTKDFDLENVIKKIEQNIV
ncbi:MAG: 1-(5-phosphoribosyl)-5-[(5-phosphoribosylamino)methylideneamino]imidazole-4-carboxamide isomerase [Endomicrobium sp.]|jgi:phosphoribosylformimino-5-aminoimidazole carboxamide ribotide isomerase|nr:1-(5-phosphoribosyl)-5-[(5-phosphoribosylamino)methylideneamino]imidazole-4-carboxamide isomerase [Endomicrobium sp.]